MRSPEDVFQDMEGDRASREAEIRLLENIASKTDNEDEQRMLRRSIVVLTYSHLEGFCKFALTSYSSAINSAKLPCDAVVTPLAAAALTKVFAALRDVNAKHPYFSKVFADDSKLHRTAREHAFLDQLTLVMSTVVEIPDDAINTESNLSPNVLKRNMYQLGLDYLPVDPHAGTIYKLLNDRNSIAHGDRLKEPSTEDVQRYTTSAFEVMKFVQAEIFNALNKKSYVRQKAA
ncbi:MAG: hypothetical protein C0519_04665 [Hyphomicrobium sp.]|nr:hypothetical protein [Hyphomicrobium sp.]PPD08508.1 MAG: hypothetical protein CTY28_03710 [Hyphomicrobium sp.]